MSFKPSLNQLVTFVEELEPDEQWELAHILLEIIRHHAPSEADPYLWQTVGGIAPGLTGGEDAQEWVTRSRREGTEAREAQWQREE